MNSKSTTRTLCLRLAALFTVMGTMIAVLPQLELGSSSIASSQTASRQTLSVQLNVW